jgi:hypothetical protein
MPEQIEHIHSHVSGPSSEPLKIKVERGAKGGYAFEVSLRHVNGFMALLQTLGKMP